MATFENIPHVSPADPQYRVGADALYTDPRTGCQEYRGTATDPTGASYTPSVSTIMPYFTSCRQDFTPGQYGRLQEGLALRQSHTAYSLTYPPTLVAAPSILVATATPRGYVQLSWRDNSTNETGFFVERSCTQAGGFVSVGGIRADETTLIDTTVSANTIYYYRVRPSNTTTGSFSATLSVGIGAVTCVPTYAYTSGCSQGELVSLVLKAC